MVDDGLSKNPGQRKRRQESRESCINNVKLNVNLTSTKDYNCRRSSIRPVDNSTYTKRPRDKFQRGSLENVSSNPWGDLHFEEQSSLRRSRSLAITREDVFTNLDIPVQNVHHHQQQQHNNKNNNNHINKPRRSQLIPRAKLIERATVKDQRYSRGSSVENLQNTERTIVKRKSSASPPDYSPPLDISPRNRPNRQISEPIGFQQQQQQQQTGHLVQPKFIIDNHQQPDSLESNYRTTKLSYRVSYEDLPELSLPNYYPDSKYDTDNTDNFTDNISTGSYSNKEKYSSCDNISTSKWTINEQESISYDENIVLSTNRPLYDSIKESNSTKPRTIRNHTPFNKDLQEKTVSYNTAESLEEKTTSKESSGDYYETDTNFDEIKLNNEKITKIVEIKEETHSNYSKNNTLSQYSNIETNPLYEQIIQHGDEDEIKEQINEQAVQEEIVEIQTTDDDNNGHNKKINDSIKTLIEVEASNEEKYEEFKTIVHVESEKTECDEQKSEPNKQHSHNYLKEFLETQKGSRKPLQNFITKKLSNLSRKNWKDFNSNLADNQFHSLPDITASKNLRKCEKIDRKLRKCEKSNESRFIVNIGKHFDITDNGNNNNNNNVPVDFEVKIAKVPRKKGGGGKKNNKTKNDGQFLEAVKNLKDTFNHKQLDENRNFAKPEIIAVKPKNRNEILDGCDQEIAIGMDSSMMNRKDECRKEYQEKLGTMRTYWDKMIHGTTKQPPQVNEVDGKEDEGGATSSSSKCKIIDVHTKVGDVKKKFEPPAEREEEKPNKVQIVKQLFEPKISEKTEKISPMIKETCNYFENTTNNNNKDGNNQFESLSPSIVEIIDKGDNKKKSPSSIRKLHKPVSKSKSVAYPEFDHVRYRVVKSDLFQKKIFANCEKESQFDGLMQYLQDYSFQELLIDNNIVIIEPIRTKIPHESTTLNSVKSPSTIMPIYNGKINDKSNMDEDDTAGLKRHFFYHPIRVNKEVNDDELPNPDTVKQVRQFFECGVKRSQSSQNIGKIINQVNGVNVDPDKDRCSATTDSNSNTSSNFNSQENLYDSITDDDDGGGGGEHCCVQQYVSEDILEKIRECGTTVTYYGGTVVKKQSEQPSLTKVIMEEIKNNEKRTNECCCNRNVADEKRCNNNSSSIKDTYQGVKFKLVKSNSCSSRLELVGTNDIKESKKRYLNKLKHTTTTTTIRQNNHSIPNGADKKYVDKNAINETIRQRLEGNQPKIIGEEKKMVQWGEVKKEKTFTGINYNDKSTKTLNYDYRNYDHFNRKSMKKIDDMEFEPYEVAQ